MKATEKKMTLEEYFTRQAVVKTAGNLSALAARVSGK